MKMYSKFLSVQWCASIFSCLIWALRLARFHKQHTLTQRKLIRANSQLLMARVTLWLRVRLYIVPSLHVRRSSTYTTNVVLHMLYLCVRIIFELGRRVHWTNIIKLAWNDLGCASVCYSYVLREGVFFFFLFSSSCFYVRLKRSVVSSLELLSSFTLSAILSLYLSLLGTYPRSLLKTL